MGFYDTLDDLREGNITQIEVINDILNQTQKDPERIQMYIDEIDFYLFVEEEELEFEIRAILQRIFKEGLTSENTKDLNLNEREKFILYVCERDKIKSFFEIPEKKRDLIDSEHPLAKQWNESTVFNPDYNHFYFVGEFWTIYSLKNKLKKYITPQPKEKPKAKDVWRLAARYELLRDLGIIDKLRTSVELIKDRQKILMQILGINEDTAKKLLEDNYKQRETQTDQLERKQLIAYIKQPPTD
jgi:hypothetical protein